MYLVQLIRGHSAMPLLRILHWLPVQQRIEFKLIVFTYKAVHSDAPKYLLDLVWQYKPARTLRSANNNLLTVVRTHVKAGITHLWLQQQPYGTLYLTTCIHLQDTPKDTFLLTVPAA